MSKPDTYELWNSAVPLSNAYWAFAPEPDRSRYRELEEETSVPRFTDRFFEREKELAERFQKEGPGAISGLFGPTRERDELADSLKSQMRDWFLNGQLRAFGFEETRTSESRPIEVPRDLLSGGFFAWDKGYIEANGLKVVAVRLALSENLADGTARPGRPSRKDEIVRAYEGLKRAGKLDFSNALNAICRQVQAHIVHLNPDHPEGMRGIGEKAIQRAIADDVRVEKEARTKL